MIVGDIIPSFTIPIPPRNSADLGETIIEHLIAYAPGLKRRSRHVGCRHQIRSHTHKPIQEKVL